MFEFFKDLFGTKRIAELRAEKAATLFKMQQLVGEKQRLHGKIVAKNAKIADLQTRIARTPVAMGAYHILARNMDKLHGVDLEQAKSLFAAERPYRKPSPAVQRAFASLPKMGEDQYS